jgi:TfoX/Sxy family transcriptional regulator of competence genes
LNAFSDVRTSFQSRPGVETTRMFGSEGLKVAGKVFAMEVKGALVVKLTAARAQELVNVGQAQIFDPGHGRPMKQWVSVSANSGQNWCALAEEAYAVVSKK